MLLTCPGCSKSFDSREPLRVGEIEVSCPYCRALATVVTTVKISKATEAPARKPISPERTILVAVEGTATKEMIQEVLTAGGYGTVNASTGKEALAALERSRPCVVLLDVGLPETMGFDLCEKIKQSERFRGMKVILVASIYDKKRYKREPDSLYGADDYIERHDIQDRLVFKVEEVLSKRPATSKDSTPALHPTPNIAKPALPAGRPVSAPAAQDMGSTFLEEATVYEPGLRTAKPVPPFHPTPPSTETTKNPLEEATVYEPGLRPTKPGQRIPGTPPLIEPVKNLLEEATVYEPGLRTSKAGQGIPTTPPPVEPAKNLLEEATVYEPGLHISKPGQRIPTTPPPAETPKNPPVAGDPAKHEAAKRLARLILSDIGLYNPKAVEQGIRNNTFHQLLKNELEEGRKLYRSRVSSEVVPDYYDQTIEEFIRKRKGSS